MSNPILFSLSEIETFALKSSRGAGMSWGLAEEAAFSARWLARHGIDGLNLLARHLESLSTGLSGAAPTIRNRCWTSASQVSLCPIATGAALGDYFNLAEGPIAAALQLNFVSAPALILPFLAVASARYGTAVIVQWACCTVVLGKDSSVSIAGEEQLLTDQAPKVIVTATVSLGKISGPAVFTEIPAATKKILDAFVQRTYVPASDRSRSGAGAEGNDNA